MKKCTMISFLNTLIVCKNEMVSNISLIFSFIHIHKTLNNANTSKGYSNSFHNNQCNHFVDSSDYWYDTWQGLYGKMSIMKMRHSWMLNNSGECITKRPPQSTPAELKTWGLPWEPTEPPPPPQTTKPVDTSKSNEVVPTNKVTSSPPSETTEYSGLPHDINESECTCTCTWMTFDVFSNENGAAEAVARVSDQQHHHCNSPVVFQYELRHFHFRWRIPTVDTQKWQWICCVSWDPSIFQRGHSCFHLIP